MAQICAFLPETITAGLSLALSARFPAYLAPAWSVSVLLRGPVAIDLAAAADGDRHALNVDAATTATWAPGEYWASVRATQGAAVFEVERARVVIAPDFAALPAGYDGRTQAEIALENIKAVIAKRATMDQERYRINNRELYRTPISDLLRLKAFYTAAVRRERGSPSGWRNIPVKFS